MYSRRLIELLKARNEKRGGLTCTGKQELKQWKDHTFCRELHVSSAVLTNLERQPKQYCSHFSTFSLPICLLYTITSTTVSYLRSLHICERRGTLPNKIFKHFLEASRNHISLNTHTSIPQLKLTTGSKAILVH
jgi:hypothetical protein